MTRIDIDNFERERKTVNSDVRICVECGSQNTEVVGLAITCSDCGTSKRFFDYTYGAKFKKGDKVRIVDSEKSSTVYVIEKITKSYDGKVQYLLKSSEKIRLLYHESEESFLENA